MGYGISVMVHAVQKSVLKGRPFGGTTTLVHVQWRAFVKVIATAGRYVIIALGNLLLINIYLPSNGACLLNEVECLFDELSVY